VLTKAEKNRKLSDNPISLVKVLPRRNCMGWDSNIENKRPKLETVNRALAIMEYPIEKLASEYRKASEEGRMCKGTQVTSPKKQPMNAPGRVFQGNITNLSNSVNEGGSKNGTKRKRNEADNTKNSQLLTHARAEEAQQLVLIQPKMTHLDHLKRLGCSNATCRILVPET
jgi:hypothetical protein